VRRLPLLLITSATLALAGCAADDEEPAEGLPGVTQVDEESAGPLVPVEVSTQLIDPEGSEVVTAWVRDDDGRAIVELEVAGLTAGFHPLYLYEVGTCDLDDTAAEGAAFVELPALLVLEDGVGSMTTLAGSMSLDELLADDGAALLIAPAVETLADIPSVPNEKHATFATGSRVACGALEG
jgi:Cu-Zn family superoxide dismutase